MIYSVQSIKNEVRRHQRQALQEDFFANEKLMYWHILLFSVWIIFYLGRVVNGILYDLYYEDEDWSKVCYNLKYTAATRVCGIMTGVAILLLFVYMSAKFSQPLDNYWQTFLLVY